ncbi:exported protein of unknown function [Ruminococcaceae bacterium BL-4]|nr:exported protein of unknown function [Ruminococcaceae bacterium BL-4]
MSKKVVRTVLFSVLLALMGIVILFVALKDKLLLPASNLWTKPSAPSSAVTSGTASEDESAVNALEPKISVPMGEAVTVYDLLFTVHDFTTTKQCDGSFSITDMIKSFNCNEDGSFSNEYNYFLTNLTVENPTDQDIEYYLNAFEFHCFDENGEKVSPSIDEVYSYDKNKKEFIPGKKDYFRYVFSAHSKETFHLVSIITDENLKKIAHIHFVVSQSGYTSHGIDESARAIILK